MNRMKTRVMTMALVCLGLVLTGLPSGGHLLAQADAQQTKAAAPASKPQTECPVMGGKINKELYVDHNGKRIYVCCPGCIDVVKKAPDKYINQLEKAGITLDSTPVALCAKCGEIKGSDKCCKLEGRTKCPKCGLLKGSPGCCKIPKELRNAVPLCPKCGEIKGSDKCCKPEGRTQCAKCRLFKGSPGCCKLPKDAKGAVPLCMKCGEIKKSAACCKRKGRTSCLKCRRFQGSPGCCVTPPTKAPKTTAAEETAPDTPEPRKDQ